MKRIYHLSTCNTNQRILQILKPGKDFELIDIKNQNIDEKTLDWIKEKVGSYEALFSRKAMKYRALGLDKQTLEEEDYRKLMLQEYTFLKRPFIIIGDEVFIGNAKNTIQMAQEKI
jgi:arsenate reductase (glutaredoxin)